MKKAIILLFFFAASCYVSPGRDAYVWLIWTIDGYPASPEICSDVGADRVTIEEDTSGEGYITWREDFPCHAGVGKTGYHFNSYETVFLKFRLVGEGNSIVSETSWEPFWPYPGENIVEIDFETPSLPRPDASIHIDWTINGEPASSSACDGVEATTVRMEHDEDGDDLSDRDFEFPCAAGEGDTGPVFFTGSRENLRFLLLAGSEVLSQTEWIIELLDRQVNEFVIDFITSPVTEPERAYVTFDWQIHYLPGDEEICRWAGAGMARLMVDEDGDGEEDLHFDFACAAGLGATEALFEEDQVIHFAFSLLGESGETLSLTPGWETLALEGGGNYLGTVNFLVGDYGPLGVELQWADSHIENPLYGGCDFPPVQVSVMGYVLRKSDGSIYDIVDIDEDPMECTVSLRWEIVDYDTYELAVQGRDEAGTTEWGSTCPDLFVDSHEPASNDFSCMIEMIAPLPPG